MSKAAGKDPLLAAICHDLRAPIAAVTMGANYVLSTTPENEASGRSRRVLQAILRSCKQMERIVRDFGDLSEIEGNAVQLRLGVSDAAELAAIAAEAVRETARAKNVEVAVKPPAAPVLVRCDRERMLRAIAHLLDNAVRFAPPSTTVTVAVSEVGADARFSVTDRGPGLDEETRANLYDRMWHARRADRVGAGLGLAVVRGFVAAHGGEVVLEGGEGTGTGTTFTIVVPKEKTSVPELPAVRPPVSAGPAGPAGAEPRSRERPAEGPRS